MASRLLTSTYKDFSDLELTEFCNEQAEASYDDIAGCVIGLGLAVVAAFVLPGVSSVIAVRLLTAIEAIGLGASVNDLIDMIEGNGGAAQRQTIIDKIKTSGGKMRVRTNYYEYTTESGNGLTYYTTTSYSWVA
ncbi:MAG: hypothetical protein ACM3TR_14200 [Caulobacteraceae bacterium]